tara:strand:- start:1945 stop:2448 length:504 start_codon:yes stop_codon:yes gene_type:complete
VINKKEPVAAERGLVMARMYSSNKGASGSSKPYVDAAPSWSNTNADEVKEIILKLAKEGHSTSEIGTILRDQHAVPSVRLLFDGRRISSILAEASVGGAYPEDMMNLMRKAVSLLEHLGKNHKDLHNSRALHITESKIRRLAKYYRREGRIAADWKYKRDQLRLIVE